MKCSVHFNIVGFYMNDRDRSSKFVELANKRVNRAIKDIQLVGNLANRTNYEYSEEQAKKILKALQQEIDVLKQAFQTAGESQKSEFRL
jgi:hypothetical protein